MSEQPASRKEIGYIDLPLDPASGADQLGIDPELERTMVAMICTQTAYPKLHERIVDAVYSTNLEIDAEESLQLDILSEGLFTDLDPAQRARFYEDLEISERDHAAFQRFHALLSRQLSDASGFTDFPSCATPFSSLRSPLSRRLHASTAPPRPAWASPPLRTSPLSSHSGRIMRRRQPSPRSW